MKDTIKVILVVIGLTIGIFIIAMLGWAMRIISLPFWKLDKQIESNEKIIERTYDADNVLYNYEWFKQRVEDIKAIENKIENSRGAVTTFEVSFGDKSKWTFEDKTEYARLTSIVMGLKNQYEDLVAEYNARAKMANKNIFQDELPLFWDLKPY